MAEPPLPRHPSHVPFGRTARAAILPRPPSGILRSSSLLSPWASCWAPSRMSLLGWSLLSGEPKTHAARQMPLTRADTRATVPFPPPARHTSPPPRLSFSSSTTRHALHSSYPRCRHHHHRPGAFPAELPLSQLGSSPRGGVASFHNGCGMVHVLPFQHREVFASLIPRLVDAS